MVSTRALRARLNHLERVRATQPSAGAGVVSIRGLRPLLNHREGQARLNHREGARATQPAGGDVQLSDDAAAGLDSDGFDSAGLESAVFAAAGLESVL